MSFLVLLLILVLEKACHWRVHLHRDDAWRSLLARVEAAPLLAGRPWRQVLLLLGIPLVVFGALLMALAPLAYGWLSLPLHVALLLWSLGRDDPRTTLAPLRASWQRGDIEAACIEAQRDLGVHAEDAAGLLAQAQAFLLWQAYQGFFAVIFWYALLGPLAALAYRLLPLLEAHAAEEGVRALATRLRHVLDWLPARGLGLGLALAGNFVAANRVLGGRLFDRQASAAQLVADAGRAAADLPAGQEGGASLDELWRLLQRAGLIWYCALALWSLLP